MVMNVFLKFPLQIIENFLSELVLKMCCLFSPISILALIMKFVIELFKKSVR